MKLRYCHQKKGHGYQRAKTALICSGGVWKLETGGQGVPSVPGWRAGSGLVPRKLGLVFRLPGPGALGLQGCFVWSVRRCPDPAILCCFWCRWRMRWRSSPGSSAKRAWSRRWRSTLRKSSFSWVLVPQLGSWRGWRDREWCLKPFCVYVHALPLEYSPVSILACAQSCSTLLQPTDCSPPGSSVHGSSQNTGVGCHFLFRGSSWPRDQTWVSSFGRQIFNHWATWETPYPSFWISKSDYPGYPLYHLSHAALLDCTHSSWKWVLPSLQENTFISISPKAFSTSSCLVLWLFVHHISLTNPVYPFAHLESQRHQVQTSQTSSCSHVPRGHCPPLSCETRGLVILGASFPSMLRHFSDLGFFFFFKSPNSLWIHQVFSISVTPEPIVFCLDYSVTSQLLSLKFLQLFSHTSWCDRHEFQIWSRSDHDTLPAKPFKPFVWINLHFTHLIRSAFPCFQGPVGLVPIRLSQMNAVPSAPTSPAFLPLHARIFSLFLCPKMKEN